MNVRPPLIRRRRLRRGSRCPIVLVCGSASTALIRTPTKRSYEATPSITGLRYQSSSSKRRLANGRSLAARAPVASLGNSSKISPAGSANRSDDRFPAMIGRPLSCKRSSLGGARRDPIIHYGCKAADQRSHSLPYRQSRASPACASFGLQYERRVWDWSAEWHGGAPQRDRTLLPKKLSCSA